MKRTTLEIIGAVLIFALAFVVGASTNRYELSTPSPWARIDTWTGEVWKWDGHANLWIAMPDTLAR